MFKRKVNQIIFYFSNKITHNMTKRFIITSGILGMLATGLLLFSNQVLTGNISTKYLMMFNTGIMVIFIHAVTLVALTFMNRYLSRTFLNTIYYFFVIGMVLFVFPLCFNGLIELTNVKIPSSTMLIIGSISLLIGWFTLILSGIAYKHKKHKG